MSHDDPPLDRDDIRTRLVPLRLIVGVMVAGQVVLALAATWLLAAGFGAQPRLLPWLLAALALLGVGELAAWPLVKAALVRDLGKGTTPTVQEALATFVRVRVIAAAMAEGFGLLGIVIYLVTGSQLALAAPALSVFVLLRLQPDPAAFRDFARASGVAHLGAPPSR